MIDLSYQLKDIEKGLKIENSPEGIAKNIELIHELITKSKLASIKIDANETTSRIKYPIVTRTAYSIEKNRGRLSIEGPQLDITLEKIGGAHAQPNCGSLQFYKKKKNLFVNAPGITFYFEK